VTGYVIDDLALISPPGTVAVSGLARSDQLDRLVARQRSLGWPAIHAAARAMATGSVLLTVDPHRYADVDLDVLSL
jgi:hypothetical protein